MSIDQLYSEIIKEHYRDPRNKRALETADIIERGFNESCGDDLQLFIKVEDGIIKDISFEGKGCAISQASASMMTEHLHGRSIKDVLDHVEEFKKMVSGEKAFPETDDYFELSSLKGVVKFPIRIKCATIAWNTLRKGIIDYLEKHDGADKKLNDTQTTSNV
jgi:nitrogen fixation NifU-like protein